MKNQEKDTEEKKKRKANEEDADDADEDELFGFEEDLSRYPYGSRAKPPGFKLPVLVLQIPFSGLHRSDRTPHLLPVFLREFDCVKPFLLRPRYSTGQPALQILPVFGFLHLVSRETGSLTSDESNSPIPSLEAHAG